MPKAVNYTNEEILLALVWTMPDRLTKGQIGRILGIKSAGQKHWRERFEKLGENDLVSIEKLDTGDLFFGSPILKYYLTEENLKVIWRRYYVNDHERNGVGIDPCLAPFSAGIWNMTRAPGFCEVIGSKFNYHFLCAKNKANPIKPLESLKLVSKEKIPTIMDAVLSIAWETEAYRQKPELMRTLNPGQRKAYAAINTLYEEQIKAHPADYKKFRALFEKSFKSYF